MAKPTLYDLQASWDDERARARFAILLRETRDQRRADCLAVPAALLLFAWAMLALAQFGGQ